MLNVAAAFGGGFYIKRALDQVPIPSLRRAENPNRSFKLTVRIVAASAPALKEPGVWSRQRPRLTVSLGDAPPKETELADYADASIADPSVRSNSSPGACARECPWRFGDSLTFVATMNDVSGSGLRLWLRAQSDLSLGPLQLQWAGAVELGEAAVDLRQRVLPSCVGRRQHSQVGGGNASWWESPVMLIPLHHVRGGAVSADHNLGQATAHVALVFCLNVDPEELLAQVEAEARQIGDVLASRADHVVRWLDAPIELGENWKHLEAGLAGPTSSAGYFPGSDISDAGYPSCTGDGRAHNVAAPGWAAHAMEAEASSPGADRLAAAPAFDATLATLTPADAQEAERRAGARSGQYELRHGEVLAAPELSPDGWISRKGPGGRRYWHHRALGPAPWEEEEERLPAPPPLGAQSAFRAGNSSTSASGSDPLLTPIQSRPSLPKGATSTSASGSDPLPTPMTSRPSLPKGSDVLGDRNASFGPIVSPELPLDGWMSHVGKDGRTFWHHQALGRAPWEQEAKQVKAALRTC